jgi:hypothetical protein
MKRSLLTRSKVLTINNSKLLKSWVSLSLGGVDVCPRFFFLCCPV